jgi:cytochrome P450
MSLAGPAPRTHNPIRQLAADAAAERRASVPYPPGPVSPSVRRTMRMTRAPLPLLLEAHERYGPVFSVRVLSSRQVFMLGPEANHHMLVSHAHNFVWRDGGFSDLIPLLGDGLLTVDGSFHRRSRRIMLPAFHRDRIAAAREVMERETDRALGAWRDGATIDLERWTRDLALRIAMRALFGLDPDARPAALEPAREFERALGFYGKDFFVQTLRGPGTPFARMRQARRRLDRVIFAEIARRRSTGARGEDILSLLLDAEDEDGSRLSDAHVRDEVMTLLFAGHDTTTSTVAFLFHELSRRPELAEALEGESLERAIDETLRLYPPAWIGPRRSVEPFAFAGHTIPGGVPVNYSSWASHRLPGVWERPEAFEPDRFLPAARAALPKGAYVPFGGGSRTCIGMRFGLQEVRVIAEAILAAFRLEATPGFELAIRQTPTIGPRDGLPLMVRAR